MRNVWRLKTHHEDPDESLRWMRVNHCIAIGWGDVGDLRTGGYTCAQDVTDAIHTAYPGIGNAPQGGANLWSFYTEMKPGDLVILSSTTPRTLVVEVTGDYSWVAEKPEITPDDPGDYQHQRRVRLSAWSPEALWRAAGGRHAPGQNTRWTLFRCTGTID